jgi:hypothetical protein
VPVNTTTSDEAAVVGERRLNDKQILDNVRSALRSITFFTKSDYVSICAVMYIPFSINIYALVLMCMRGG